VLKAELGPDLNKAYFDAEGLHTCLSNLISNAIDACEVSDKKNPEVIVRCFEIDDRIIFKVLDQGIGIDEEIRHKVFTTFFTTKEEGGTGIGLLQTRKITQEHGGKVSLTSVEDVGTTFTLEFPRDRLPLPKEESDEEN